MKREDIVEFQQIRVPGWGVVKVGLAAPLSAVVSGYGT